MEDNYQKLQQIAKEGYSIEFGDVLEKSFENFKKCFGIMGLSLILLSIVLFIVLFGIFGAIVGFSEINQTMIDFNPMMLSGTFIIIYLIFAVVFSGIMAGFNAGFYKMVHETEINNGVDVGTLFYYFRTHYFKELFVAAALIALGTTGMTILFELLHLKIIGMLVTYIISFLTFLTVPLIIFSDLKTVQAISMSIRLTLKKPLILIGLLLVAIILAMLGFIAFCIGIFFTLPFIYSMVYMIYTTISPIKENNIIDEIGRSETE